MRFPELTDEEIFQVLLCGKKPTGGYTIEDYGEEWNYRVKNEWDGGYEVLVSPSDE